MELFIVTATCMFLLSAAEHIPTCHDPRSYEMAYIRPLPLRKDGMEQRAESAREPRRILRTRTGYKYKQNWSALFQAVGPETGNKTRQQK